MRTIRQTLGDYGERYVADHFSCYVCNAKNSYELLPVNSTSADLKCVACRALAQVKTIRRSAARGLPPKVIGSAWNPQKLLIEKGCFVCLYFVVTDMSDQPAVYICRPEYQSAEMFLPRKPLSDKAKTPGWIGYMIVIGNALEQPALLTRDEIMVLRQE